MKVFKEDDKIVPSKYSPFIGTAYETNDFRVHKVINKEKIIVIRNGWHEFESMNCYFDKD